MDGDAIPGNQIQFGKDKPVLKAQSLQRRPPVEEKYIIGADKSLGFP
jgi:hypothetical protein